MSSGGEPPSAEAGTRSSLPFVVSTTVQAGCTVFAWDLPFPTYASGQATTETGNTMMRIFCSSANAVTPFPVKVRVQGTGGFKMSNGGSSLNYRLCWDLACADVIKGVDRQVFLDRVGYDIPIHGEILANQLAAVGPHSQTVTVRVTY